MSEELSLDDFLTRNHISKTTWQSAKIEWAFLQEIATDHREASYQLSEAAGSLARLIQKIDKVHSVRWRVKDTDHLLEKIVRKRADGVQKYLEISAQNYFGVVTDLVGIRALHLYKEDCIPIDVSIRKQWKPVEIPVAYVRKGDPEDFLNQLSAHGFEVKDHPDGYRSIHYIVETNPTTRRVLSEIQVRTVFEEGWSEIDHNIRYPNFSKDTQIGYFLSIFNRMAGSADEMGSFVRGLNVVLQKRDADLAALITEKEQSVLRMEDAIAQLESANLALDGAMDKDKASSASINSLKNEVAKLRTEAATAHDRRTVPTGGLLSPNALSDGVRNYQSENLGFGPSLAERIVWNPVPLDGLLLGQLPNVGGTYPTQLTDITSFLEREKLVKRLAEIQGGGLSGLGALTSTQLADATKFLEQEKMAKSLADMKGGALSSLGALTSTQLADAKRLEQIKLAEDYTKLQAGSAGINMPWER